MPGSADRGTVQRSPSFISAVWLVKVLWIRCQDSSSLLCIRLRRADTDHQRRPEAAEQPRRWFWDEPRRRMLSKQLVEHEADCVRSVECLVVVVRMISFRSLRVLAAYGRPPPSSTERVSCGKQPLS